VASKQDGYRLPGGAGVSGAAEAENWVEDKRQEEHADDEAGSFSKAFCKSGQDDDSDD